MFPVSGDTNSVTLVFATPPVILYQFRLRLNLVGPYSDMPQSRGICGHKRGDWDTHSKCLSCCGCSRLVPCVISALWASDTWTIAESRRAHRSRRGTRSPLSIGSASSHRSRELSGDIRPLFESPVRVTLRVPLTRPMIAPRALALSPRVGSGFRNSLRARRRLCQALILTW